MSNNSSGGFGCIVGFIGLMLVLALGVGSCTGAGSGSYHGTKGNPYQPGTTNHERYERLYN